LGEHDHLREGNTCPAFDHRGASFGKTFSVFADDMASWWPIDTTRTRLRKWLAGEKLLDALVRKTQNLSSVADAQVRFIY
jgi:hypothetical protein